MFWDPWALLTQRNRAGRRDLGRARCWQLLIGRRDRDLQVPWRRLGSPCPSAPWLSWMMEPSEKQAGADQRRDRQHWEPGSRIAAVRPGVTVCRIERGTESYQPCRPRSEGPVSIIPCWYFQGLMPRGEVNKSKRLLLRALPGSTLGTVPCGLGLGTRTTSDHTLHLTADVSAHQHARPRLFPI